MSKNIEVPELDHDARMFARYQTRVSPNGRLERRIVAALCAHLATHGWEPRLVFDGSEEIGVSNAKQAMELIFNLDTSRVVFGDASGRTHWVLLVNGNGIDMVSDYSFARNNADSFESAMEAFDPEEYA